MSFLTIGLGKVENLFYLICLLALGKLSRLLPAFPKNTSTVLNQFVIYISFPATILLKLNGLEVRLQLLMLAVIPWLLVGFSIIIVKVIADRLKWKRDLTGAVMLCVALGNTSFFGFPVIAVFLGEQYLSYAIIYDQLGTFLALVSIGTLIVSVYGEEKDATAKGVLHRVISFPPFIAMILGFILMKVQYPTVLLTMLEGLSATLIPVVTVSVGSVLIFRQPLGNMIPIGIAMGLKMVISPLIVFALLSALNIRGPVFFVSVFEAGMPSMVMAGVIVAAGKLRSDVANAAIGYGILFSFITLPILHYLFRFYK